MKRQGAYIYTRVSTAIQTEGYSLEAQRQKLLDYAKYRGFTICGEYTDAGSSGKNIAGRVQFQKMLEDIELKKDDVQYVLVFKLSRFGRNAADVLNSLQFMQDYGVNLICVEDNIDSSVDSGKLMISVMSAMAEIERENILVQTMSGRKQKATNGCWNGGFAPYGYKLTDGQLVIVEDEAQVIRDIYSLYLSTAYGGSYVAKEINKRYAKKVKLPKDIDRFSSVFVKRILDNPIYCGKIAYGRRTNTKIEGKRNEYHVIKQADESQIIIADGKHEPIVSQDIWDAAHQKRLENAVKQERLDKEHVYILSGLVRCPDCGAPMYGRPNGKKKKKDGTLYPMSYSYVCRNKLQETGHTCPGGKQFSETKLLESVNSIIIGLITEQNFKEVVDASLNDHLNRDTLLNELKKAEDDLSRLRHTKERIEFQLNNIDYRSKTAEMLEESLTGRLMKVMEDISDIQDRIDNIRERLLSAERLEEAKKGIYDFLESYEEIYQMLSDEEKKSFMKLFVDSIELYPRTKRSGQWIKQITFNFPVKNKEGELLREIRFPSDTNFPTLENTSGDGMFIVQTSNEATYRD